MFDILFRWECVDIPPTGTTIMSIPYAVLPLFATRFAARTGGIYDTFIEPYLIWSDIKLFVWDI